MSQCLRNGYITSPPSDRYRVQQGYEGDAEYVWVAEKLLEVEKILASGEKE